MSRPEVPYDHAVVASFYKTLAEGKLLAGGKFMGAQEAEKAVFEHIEMFLHHQAYAYRFELPYTTRIRTPLYLTSNRL